MAVSRRLLIGPPAMRRCPARSPSALGRPASSRPVAPRYFRIHPAGVRPANMTVVSFMPSALTSSNSVAGMVRRQPHAAMRHRAGRDV